MKRRMLRILLVVLLGAALVLGGTLLYRHFVTDRISDRGGMENPFLPQAPEETGAPEENSPDTINKE